MKTSISKRCWAATQTRLLTVFIPLASVLLSITFGCAEAWQESYREMSKINEGNQIPSTSYNSSWQDIYWMRQQSKSNMQHSINELERIKREAAWDTARINAANRRILYEMELQKKLKELERQQKEMQRQR